MNFGVRKDVGTTETTWRILHLHSHDMEERGIMGTWRHSPPAHTHTSCFQCVLCCQVTHVRLECVLYHLVCEYSSLNYLDWVCLVLFCCTHTHTHIHTHTRGPQSTPESRHPLIGPRPDSWTIDWDRLSNQRWESWIEYHCALRNC